MASGRHGGYDRLVRFSTEDLLAFRDRDWALFERTAPVLSSARSAALAASLYEEMRIARPDWPTPDDREEDLSAHLRLIENFARIARAGRRGVDPR
jgi:hypothetical protein